MPQRVARAPGPPSGSGTNGRGRPRSRQADAAILGATMRILVADGYEGLSMEGVAAAAGVAKTTIYRRYPAKRDLVIAALRAGTDALPPADAFDDDTRVALGRLVEEAVGTLVHTGAIRVLASLIASDAREPGLMDEFRARIIEPRRQALAMILRRGIERGHLRPDLDPLVVTEMLAGTILAHHLVLGMTADRAWTEALTDTLWRGISVPPRHARGGHHRARDIV